MNTETPVIQVSQCSFTLQSFSQQTARPQSYRFLSVHLLHHHSHSRRRDPSHTGSSVFIYFTIILTTNGKTPVIQVPQCSFTLQSFSQQMARPQSYRFLSVHLLYNHSHSRRRDPSHKGSSVVIYFTIHSHSRRRDPSHTGFSVFIYFTIILTADDKTPVIQVPQ